MTANNIFGPGHYGSTGETADRPTPIATSKAFRAWFAQCALDGTGGTKIDEMFLNFILATFRNIADTSGATQGELIEDMGSESLARYASGGIYCADGGIKNAAVLASPLSFIMPKTLFNGQMVMWEPAATNDAASTVNAFATGVKKLFDHKGNELVGGELLATVTAFARWVPSANSGAGAWLLMPWSFPRPRGMRAYQAAGTFTWTVPAGVYRIGVRVVGAGGGGGAVATNYTYAGGDGGGGGWAEGWLDVLPGATYAVVVGAKGTGNTGSGNGVAGGLSDFGGGLLHATGGGGGLGTGATVLQGGRSGIGSGTAAQRVGGLGDGSPGAVIDNTGLFAPGVGGGPGGQKGAGSGVHGFDALGPGGGGGGTGNGAGGSQAGHGHDGEVIIEW